MGASSALHRALADFGEGAAAAPRPFPRPAPAAAEPVAPTFSRQDLDRAAAQAELLVRESLTLEHLAARETAVREAVAQALAAERLVHREAMERAAGEQVLAAAAAIASAMEALQEQVCTDVSTACARLLAPVLSEDAARRAVEALAGALRAAFEEEGSFRVVLSGPAELRASLRAALAELPLQWGEREAPGFDLSAAFDGRVLATRLGEWTALLRGDEP